MPYSRCFVGSCFQDLFNIARNILVYQANEGRPWYDIKMH